MHPVYSVVVKDPEAELNASNQGTLSSEEMYLDSHIHSAITVSANEEVPENYLLHSFSSRKTLFALGKHPVFHLL